MGRKWQSMTGWFAPRCAYVHDCHSNTPLCTHPRTHACTCLGSGTTKRPNQHQASQANNTTGSINLSRVADDGQHAAMKCGCRVKRWDCINEYRRKTSCHREFELVHDRFGQGQKLSHSLPPAPFPVSTDGTNNTREHKKRLHQLRRKQTVLRYYRNGMFLHRQPPTPNMGATIFPAQSETEGDKWKLNFFLFSLFPSTTISSLPFDVLQRASGRRVWWQGKGGTTVHNSQGQALRNNIWKSTWQTCSKTKVLYICTPMMKRQNLCVHFLPSTSVTEGFLERAFGHDNTCTAAYTSLCSKVPAAIGIMYII